MTQITAADLNNAKSDVDTIANIANSTSTSVTDRLGNTRRTLYSLANEFPNASDNAAAAAADRVQTAADRVQTGLDVIAAEAARDAAQLSSGIYETVSSGIANTANGDYFFVESASSNAVVDFYKNNSGSGVYVNSYPSLTAINARHNTISIDLTAGGLTLTSDQAAVGTITLVGSPSSATNIATPNYWVGQVVNNLSNTNAITIKTSAGTGVVVPRYAAYQLRADGVNVVLDNKIEVYARRVVTGRVISRAYDGSGNIVISTTGGAVYDENNNGNPKYTIASVSNATLAANQALVVDLDSASDGNGNKVPSVVSLASSSQTGWQTGNKVVLFANKSLTTNAKSYAGEYFIDCPDPDNDSATNARRARRVVDGRIVSIDYASDSITVGYTQGRVWDENNAGLPKYKINSGSATLTASQALIVDLDGSVDGNGRLTPSIVNIASSLNTGWQYGNKFVLFNCASASSSATDSNDLIFGAGCYKIDIKKDLDTLYVQQTSGVIKIFCKSAKEETDNYTRFTLIHKTNAPTNTDIWHIEGVWDSKLVAWNETKLQEILRTAGAEVELAVKVNGAADFVGGSTHGYQELSEAILFVDGKLTPIDQIAKYKCRKLEAIQKSVLYFHGTSTPLANVWHVWEWTRDELLLTTTFEFQAVANLDFLYAGILPVWRTRGSGASSSGSAVEIVTVGRRSPKYESEDLSTSGYASVYSDAAILRGYGTGGYNWQLEKLSGWDKPNRRARFAPEVDNKFYQDVVGNAYVTAIGEIITVKSKITIQNPY